MIPISKALIGDAEKQAVLQVLHRTRHKAVGQAGWLFISTVGAGISNFAASLFAARALGPADYGTVNSLTAAAFVIGVIASIVQTVIATHIGHLQAGDAEIAIGASLRGLLRWLLATGAFAASATMLLSPLVATWLHIASPMPVVMVGLLLVPTGALAAVNGVLQGMGRFAQLGGLQFCLAAVRLMFCVGLVLLGSGAAGAVASQPASAAVTVVLGLALVRGLLRQQDGTLWAPDWFRLSGQASLSLVSFAILVSADVVIAKNRLSGSEAGIYSGIATLGRTGLWVSAPIAAMLLPKLSQRHARQRSVTPLLRRGLAATVFLCGSIAIAFAQFSSPLVRVVMGPAYVANTQILSLYCLATTGFALVNTYVSYFIALQDVGYSYALLLATLALLYLLANVARDSFQFVAVLVAVAVFLCLVGELLIHRSKWRVS